MMEAVNVHDMFCWSRSDGGASPYIVGWADKALVILQSLCGLCREQGNSCQVIQPYCEEGGRKLKIDNF